MTSNKDFVELLSNLTDEPDDPLNLLAEAAKGSKSFSPPRLRRCLAMVSNRQRDDFVEYVMSAAGLDKLNFIIVWSTLTGKSDAA